MCLWGNATDLSLLTNMTHEDIQKLQTVSKDEQAERAQFILLDQGESAWEQLRANHERVDIVLDNAGFEVRPWVRLGAPEAVWDRTDQQPTVIHRPDPG